MKRRYLTILYTLLIAVVCLGVAWLNFTVLSDRHSDLTDNTGIGLIAPPAPTDDLGLLASPEPGDPTRLATPRTEPPGPGN